VTCKGYDPEPILNTPSTVVSDNNREDCSLNRRHLEQNQHHQKSLSPTECHAGKPSISSCCVEDNNVTDEERRNDDSSLTSDELLSRCRYQTDDEKVACQGMGIVCDIY
jgi:hypothetical protein